MTDPVATIDRAYATATRLIRVAKWLSPNEPLGVTEQEWSDLWALWYYRYPDQLSPEDLRYLSGHRLVRCPNVTFVTNT